MGVEIHDGEGLLFQLRKDVLLQILFHAFNAHSLSREVFADDAEDFALVIIPTADLEEVKVLDVFHSSIDF